jgi:glycerol dehydrogenase-like iron-containing ADH family enzyme
MFNRVTASLETLSRAGPPTHAAAVALVRAQRTLSAVINNDGTTRYVSGVEHLIAHSLTRLGVTAPHGVLVGIGVLLGAALQRRHSNLTMHLTAIGFQTMSPRSYEWLSALCRPLICGKQALITKEVLLRAASSAPSIRAQPRPTVLDGTSDADLRNLISEFTT